jgi:hypothetical protein
LKASGIEKNYASGDKTPPFNHDESEKKIEARNG